ncbi:adenosylcobinamide-GDP ribazoletransferase, partial [Sulfurovum sp. bin170]|uniref:adenosylcobinamide-GDP ribazoletransferase n=1 Tax=Sulfurovum sp. bin170 TaxID=2695268 RepID=UPI0013E0487A
MRNLYLGFKFSFSYFTILPIKFRSKDDLSKKEVLNHMLLTLPFVGFILGLLTVVLFTFLAKLGWYGAIISAVAYMMMYGFIHTEAVVDVYDAMYASHSGKDAFEIIKEPTVGALGVLYAVGFVLMKVAGIVVLLTHNLLAEFVAVLIISRLSLLTQIILHDFKSSFVTGLKESLDYWYLMPLFLIFTTIGSYLTLYFILYLLVGIVMGFVISIFFASKLKFVNGDVLGATLEGVEILLFLLVV